MNMPPPVVMPGNLYEFLRRIAPGYKRIGVVILFYKEVFTMDWCPVEWPPRTTTGSTDLRHKRESGQKAIVAGVLGILILLGMAGMILSYAVLAQGRDAWQPFAGVTGYIEGLVSGQIPVTLTADGRTLSLQTRGKRVQDVLSQQGIQIKPGDRVSPGLTTSLGKNMYIKVTRIQVKTETKQAAIPFTVKYVQTSDLPKGLSHKVREGKEGQELQTWEIRYEDGLEASRTCTSREVQRNPVDSIVQVGTRNSISRGGQPLRFSRAYDMLATGYTYTGYNTASGAAPGTGIVAVDPRVIPLGTRLFIEGYGNAVALDTGGLIKGNRVDLFFETEHQALQWGARRTQVYVMD